MSWKRWIHEVRFTVSNAGPLHIGEQDGQLLLDEESGCAIIPGASLTGALRAYLEQEERLAAGEMISALFGTRKLAADHMSSDLRVDDLVSTRAAAIEERSAVRIDGVSGSAFDKHVFHRLYVSSGTVFHGRLVWTAQHEAEQEDYTQLVKQCLSALHQGIIRIGAYKSSGGGKLAVKAIRHKVYDTHQLEQYFAFLIDGRNRNQSPGADQEWGLPCEWLNEVVQLHAYQYELTARIASPMLIRDHKWSLSEEADAYPIRADGGKFYVPGTSWKGAIRHQLCKILHYYEKAEWEHTAFGSAHDEQNKEDSRSAAGYIRVEDAYIDEDKRLPRQTADYFGIHIDKFTGGVKRGALKHERTVRGRVILRLHMLMGPDDKERQAVAGALLLAFRDLAEQGFTLGSGFANGRGYLTGEMLRIRTPNGDVVINFANRSVDNRDLADSWIRALQEGEREACKV